MVEFKKKLKSLPVLEAEYLDSEAVQIRSQNGDDIEINKDFFEEVTGYEFKPKVHFQLVPLKKGERKGKNTVEIIYSDGEFSISRVDGLEGLCYSGFRDGTGIDLPEKVREEIKKAEDEGTDYEPVKIFANVVLVNP